MKQLLLIMCVLGPMFGLIFYMVASAELSDDQYVQIWNKVHSECPELKKDLKQAARGGKITISERNKLWNDCKNQKIKKLKRAIENI